MLMGDKMMTSEGIEEETLTDKTVVKSVESEEKNEIKKVIRGFYDRSM